MNTQWILARKPPGGLPTDEDFRLVETPIPEPGANQMLTRTIYLSLDPYQWGRKRSGVEAIGEVCHGRTVSQVVKSNLPEYTEGDFVFNTNGWQEYGLSGDGISVFEYMFPRKLDPAQAPISTAVGIMGMLGLTAYSGMALQCKPQAGETVVVSAASGGVGQIAGQIAKICGCRVVGIAGMQEKCDFVTGVLGFDACVSHRSTTLAADLAAACPAGIDAYFENVGGKVFDAVLPLCNRQARISLCGLVSQYGTTTRGDPHDVWMAQGAAVFERQHVQVHRLHVRDFVKEHQTHFFTRMADWIRAGKVKYKEDLWPGLAQAPKAFRAMLEGGNFGKTLVGVGEDPTLSPALKTRRASTNVLSG
ncbi:MAG TPA: NADP-dependent oxidoreductase [Candidatus Tectomicrobia bacterium]